ncbi:MFS transporter [Micromonospora sp. CA-240977]|uniref:MFS transporter n=1 Tax=Micromonospora sp. CA-240977 TaxID=3239957 RepID=UPI003D8EC119
MTLRDDQPGLAPTGAATPAGPGAARPTPWTVLVVLACAQAMVALDVTVVNVALPAIDADLRFGPGDVQWVVSVYVLATGGLLLLGGRLADLFGARRVFLAGLILFTVASAVSGLSNTSALLVASRAMQGAGAALLSPAALSIIALVYDGERRAKALGAWGAIASGGAAAGLLVGGALTTWLDWRWAFFINLPVGLLVLILVPRLISRSPRVAATGQLDLIGAVVGTAAFAVTIYGISDADRHGWGATRTVLLLAVGVALLGLFAGVERHVRRPLVPPALWRQRSLAASTVGIFGATITLVGALFLGAFMLQTTLRASALETGFALLPMVVAIALAAHLGGALLGHLGPRWASAVGLAVAAVGALLLSRATTPVSYPADILPGLVLLGFGLGLSFVVFSVTALSGIEGDRAGSASGLYMTSHDIGGAFGVAILSSAAGAVSGGSLLVLAGQQRGFLVAAGVTAGFAIVAALTMPAGRPATGSAAGLHGGHGFKLHG